jgi:hypothetical protein
MVLPEIKLLDPGFSRRTQRQHCVIPKYDSHCSRGAGRQDITPDKVKARLHCNPSAFAHYGGIA